MTKNGLMNDKFLINKQSNTIRATINDFLEIIPGFFNSNIFEGIFTMITDKSNLLDHSSTFRTSSFDLYPINNTSIMVGMTTLKNSRNIKF